jgi:hypothetical protein
MAHAIEEGGVRQEIEGPRRHAKTSQGDHSSDWACQIQLLVFVMTTT